jgi:hypothetical protein
MMLLGPLVVQQQAAVPLLSRNTVLEAISPTAPYLLWSVVAILSTNPSLVLAIISMTLFNALVVWSQPGRLFVPRILADCRVRVTTVGSMLLPLLLSQISLVLRNISVPRMLKES